jgi:glycosyltransferase involved in cell wall biosynthesis
MPLGDANAMAKPVVFLLENPEVARKIGEAGIEFGKKYDWKTVAERELKEIQACARGSCVQAKWRV